MIEKMHDRTNGPVFKVIFALVSLSFVIGGIGGGFIASDNFAAKVNGESISSSAFSEAKRAQESRLYNQLGERAWDLLDSPEYSAQFNRTILNELVNEELLRQYAKELKLGISADQIKAEIVNNPSFQQDGKFSNDLYLQSLRQAGLTADGYAALTNEAMLFAQIQEGILNSHFTVPAEEALLAKLLFQQRQVRLANFPIATEAAKQAVTSEEISAYYEKNKQTLLEPEKLVVEYVSITPKDVEKNVQITNEQIETFYQTNRKDYVTAGESRLAHIQFANQADANAALTALQNGEDFAAVAKSKSTDKLSASQGGDLGWAKAGTFPKAFEDAAQTLEIGKFSQPVQVDGAYHIIKVLERKAEVEIPLAQVKDKIAETIRQDLVLQEYSKITQEMANKAFENAGSLEAVAKDANLTVHKTAEFSRTNIPTELSNEKVVKVLFEGDLRQSGQNSEALSIGDDKNPQTMFVRVSQYQAERVKSLEEAKAEIEQTVKNQKAEASLKAFAEKSIKTLNEGGTVEIKFAPQQTFVYAQNDDAALFKTIFSMPKPTDKPTYQMGSNANGDVVIVGLDKVEDGKAEAIKPLLPQVNNVEQLSLRANLLQNLREKASIEVNEEILQNQTRQ